MRQGGSVRQKLDASASVDREFDLVSMFPRLALDTGAFSVSYKLDDEGRLRTVGPERVTVTSGPAAIPRLLDVLSHEDADVRGRAAGLIHRMTAQQMGYVATAEAGQRTSAAERWKSWWTKTGIHLTWNFRSTGATFGQVASAGPPDRRSQMIGGIAYRRRTLAASDVDTLSSVLTGWLRTPTVSVAALRGTVRVADQAFVYPPEDTMIEPSEGIVRLLTSALSSAARGGSLQSSPGAVMLILASIAKMPDERFVPALEELHNVLSRTSAATDVEPVVDGLLDVLDWSRTPVGDER